MSSSQTLSTNALGGSLGFPDIALTGKAGAGKSTAADLLVELGYQKRSLAAPLKDIAARLWGEEARTDRDKLQKLGVAVREIEEDTWVNLLVSGVRGERDGGLQAAPVVVDDMRFPNEYWALKAEGFVVVRLGAETNQRVDRLKATGKWQDEEQLTHISETALDDHYGYPDSYYLWNAETKDELYDSLVNIVIKERRRR